MPHQCSLHLFGLVDHAGLRDLLTELADADFSLPLDPFEFYCTRVTSTSYVEQDRPCMRESLLQCLYRRGIFAQWHAVDKATGKIALQMMLDPAAQRAIRFSCLEEDGEIGPLRLHPRHAGDPEAAQILRRWPDQSDILLGQQAARLIVISSRHDAISRAAEFAAFPLAFDAYRPG